LNKYSYALNRPTVLTDQDGAWPGWYHHEIIEDVFGPNGLNLGTHAIETLEFASDWMDSWTAGNQAPKLAFMHGMSDGKHHQSVGEAEQLANDYVNSELQSAVREQLDYESYGNEGISDNALIYFGHALHTVTDEPSPEHDGFQPWYCLVCPSALFHSAAEEYSARSSNEADAEKRYLAHVKANRLWAQYQAALAAERKRRQAEKDKKAPCAPDHGCQQPKATPKQEGPS
jgi:hypothetical protein